jgi:hypothetical protein
VALICTFIIIIVIPLLGSPLIYMFATRQRKLLEALFSLPKAVLQWRHDTIVRMIEQEAGDNDTLSPALLAVMSTENKATESESSDETSGRGGQIFLKGAMRSLRSVRVHPVMLISVVLLAILPQAIVFGRDDTDAVTTAEYYLLSTPMIGDIYQTFIGTREMFLAVHSNSSSKTAWLQYANASLSSLDAKFNALLQGNDKIKGFKNDRIFQGVAYGNACNYLSPGVVAEFAFPEKCDTFDSARLKQGVNGAMQVMLSGIADLLKELQKVPMTLQPTDAVNRLKYLEMLSLQVASVFRSTRAFVETRVQDSQRLQSQSIAPVQMTTISLVCVVMYFGFLVPFINELQRSHENLHALLMIMWASTRSISEPTKFGTSKSRPEARSPPPVLKSAPMTFAKPEQEVMSISSTVPITKSSVMLPGMPIIEQDEDEK